ncbi:MAG TPA: dihydroorotate dehydrogenase, partial [Gemmatimonadaceae bacterium]|nr:dihydroorotate dehydrogenase [Gemmatimonadaceae bacterium]
MTTASNPLAVSFASLEFQNPLILAAGTAAFGRELAGVIDLDTLGGIVTKAVSPAARQGAPAPRVADFEGGMINAVGLANPGVETVRDQELPWLEAKLRKSRVIVNVVGDSVEDFATVVRELDDAQAISLFELNVSCPNVRSGGMEFGADDATLAGVVRLAREATKRPITVKLSPTLPDIARSAQIAVDAGADALTLINTIPGLVIDVETRRPAIGFGSGGVSGPGLLPVGVLAVWKVHQAVDVPLIGVGGVAHGTDALQYLLAGATLVGMGTAVMKDPRSPVRVLKELTSWCKTHHVSSIAEIIGTLEWPE